MIDLTPLDVRKKRGDFRRQLRGYDPEEVDTFMDLVADRFEELVRENLSLNEKTARLEGQLGALEGRESAVQEALVTAQKLREEVKDQSQRDAEVLQDQAARTAEILKAEANAEINRRLGEAEGLIRERQRALEELERSRLKFLKSFRGLLEREMDAVDVEESRRPLEDTPLELEFRGWMPDGEMDEEDDYEADLDSDPVPFVSSVVEDVEVVEAVEEFETVEDEEPEAVEEVEEVEEVEAVEEEEPEAVEEVEAEEEVVEVQEEEPEAMEEVEVEEEVEEAQEEEFEALEEMEVAADEVVEEAITPAGEPWEGVAQEVELSDPAVDSDDPGLEEEGGEGLGGFETQILEVAPPPEPDTEPTYSPPQEPKWLFSLLKKEEDDREGQG